MSIENPSIEKKISEDTLNDEITQERLAEEANELVNPFEAKRQEVMEKLSTEDKAKFEQARAAVEEQLFGLSDRVEKARTAAIAAIDSPEAADSFNQARQEALDYIDAIVGDKAMQERTGSPEFQAAIEAVKAEAKTRGEAIIAKLNEPTVEEMVEERKTEFASRMQELQNEVKARMEKM